MHFLQRGAPLYWGNRPSLGYRYDVVAEAMGKDTEFGMRLAAGYVFVVSAYLADASFSSPYGCGFVPVNRYSRAGVLSTGPLGWGVSLRVLSVEDSLDFAPPGPWSFSRGQMGG